MQRESREGPKRVRRGSVESQESLKKESKRGSERIRRGSGRVKRV